MYACTKFTEILVGISKLFVNHYIINSKIPPPISGIELESTKVFPISKHRYLCKLEIWAKQQTVNNLGEEPISLGQKKLFRQEIF